MRTTIERVRITMVAVAALVALIVLGFLVVAHRQRSRLLRDLPARLGVDIQKETNGYTISRSVKGRTIFTLHAAKATQHKDGLTSLDDVGIVLYGQRDERADRIYGKQFEYDQKNGIVRAMGEVQLDLQAPAPTTANARAEYARGGKAEGVAAGAGAQPVHVVTSGLVFLQRLGEASTDQPIHFEYRGMTGQARGAAYSSDTGLTTLESEVRVSAIKDGRPTVLTAAHAELDRGTHRLVLRTARYLALPKNAGDAGTTESMAAGELVVHLREDGGVEGAEGSGGVEVASGPSRMQAPRGTVRLSEAGQPTLARMEGGVRFANEGGRRATADAEAIEGDAATADAHFDGKGNIGTVELQGGVRAHTRGVVGERELRGSTMTLRMAAEGAGARRYVQTATLRGSAEVRTEVAASGRHTEGVEVMRANELVAQWAPGRGQPELREVTGNGATELERSRDGGTEVSRGDSLQASFAAREGLPRDGAKGSSASLTTATQRGNVSMDRASRTREGAAQSTHARAEEARYEAATGQMELQGAVTLRDESSELRANHVTLSEATGDAEATGAVQVSYRRSADGAPGEREADAVHVVAEQAVSRKQSGLTTFRGASGSRARLWQGPSQVEAPVLVFGREQGTLEARGTEGGGEEAMPVRTLLAGKGTDTGKPEGGLSKKPEILRVRSGELHYVDASRRAEFSGGVLLVDSNGSMSSREAVATLAAKPETGAGSKGAASKAAGVLGGGGGVERVTATGAVTIRQPGRVATGEQAVYTAADDAFVLTGGPPKVVDEVNGSVTGAALRFRPGDNSVTVEGRAGDGAARTADGRVHTRTRVKQ